MYAIAEGSGLLTNSSAIRIHCLFHHCYHCCCQFCCCCCSWDIQMRGNPELQSESGKLGFEDPAAGKRSMWYHIAQVGHQLLAVT
jgi:hypothetical protein